MRGLLRSARPVLLLEVHGEAGWPALEELKATNYLLFELMGTEPFRATRLDEIVHVLARPG